MSKTSIDVAALRPRIARRDAWAGLVVRLTAMIDLKKGEGGKRNPDGQRRNDTKCYRNNVNFILY